MNGLGLRVARGMSLGVASRVPCHSPRPTCCKTRPRTVRGCTPSPLHHASWQFRPMQHAAGSLRHRAWRGAVCGVLFDAWHSGCATPECCRSVRTPCTFCFESALPRHPVARAALYVRPGLDQQCSPKRCHRTVSQGLSAHLPASQPRQQQAPAPLDTCTFCRGCNNEVARGVRSPFPKRTA